MGRVSKHDLMVRVPNVAAGAGRVGALAVGALAVGALAVGALAVGRVAVGRAVVGRLSIGRLEVKELVVDGVPVRPGSVLAASGTGPAAGVSRPEG
jgi:hypothetical protein